MSNCSLDMFVGMQNKASNYQRMSTVELGEKQQMVLGCLQRFPDGLTDKMIAVETGLSLSSVCGRRNELMQMGLVCPVSICSYVDEMYGSLKSNIIWGVCNGD